MTPGCAHRPTRVVVARCDEIAVAAHAALPAGGALVVIEAFTIREHKSNTTPIFILFLYDAFYEYEYHV